MGVRGQKVALLARRREEVVEGMRELVEGGAMDAAGLGDGEVPLGWEEKRVRVAQDMRKPRSRAPVWIEVMQRAVEGHDRVQAERTGRDVLLSIGSVNVVVGPEYPKLVLEKK